VVIPPPERRASEDEVRTFLAKAPASIPRSYVEFLATRGALEVQVAELDSAFVLLWPLHEVLGLNQGYGFEEFAPELFGFGSDGGGELYAFDLRDLRVGRVPAIPLERASFVTVAKDFEQFAAWLRS
jgi:hypothetical protein